MAKQNRTTAHKCPQDFPLNLARMALYARVSTSNGHQDPEMQLAELREYTDRRGWEIVGEYTDQGVSGSKESRPELNRLMTDAHRRRFDAVLVRKIDRFGRSPKHLVNALADLGAYGVAFISLRDNLDLSTPSMFAERTCASLPFAHSMWRRWSRRAHPSKQACRGPRWRR